MIRNERQYKITKHQLEKLKIAFTKLQEPSNAEDDWAISLQLDALNSQIEELYSELKEFESLSSGQFVIEHCSDLRELPSSLIKARIANGLSQKQLAELLNLKAQQIQRYEASEYMGASLSTLIKVADQLNIRISEVQFGSKKTTEQNDFIFYWDKFSSLDWSMFPIKEAVRREWFVPVKGLSLESSFKSYIHDVFGNQLSPVLHRKKFFGENKPKEYSLLAWQIRVLQKAKEQRRKFEVPVFELNDSWMRELVDLTNYEDGPIRAQKLLLEKGILLVVEKHLEQTYLDGAAMLDEMGNPVIGMTLRHDRVDNFWFVLFHELGHIFTHLYDSLVLDFFDEEGGVQGDELEKEADEYSLEKLIPSEKWKMCLSRFSLDKNDVVADAKRIGVSPAILAGRIRKESGNYSLLTELVGSRKVRRLFN